MTADRAAGPLPLGLYVHVPFCHSECTYCDFYRVSYREREADAFLEALRLELASLPRDLRPTTVYVGGGTPSALREDQLEDLVAAIEPFRAPGQEYTFEVNPKSAAPRKVEILARAGVTRVSFGAQTFAAEALRLLGRRHGPEDIARVYELLRGAIPSVSFDLIFALPGQSRQAWELDLRAALALRPDHLSIYSLVYEPGTPLAAAVARGELQPASEELEREMFLSAVDNAAASGYEHYEVSSFAQPGHRSRHNQAYWRQEDYVGVGPGATTTLGSVRYTNERDLHRYVRQLRETGVPPRSDERLTPADKVHEHLLLRLRTGDGLSLSRFQELAGVSLEAYTRGGLSRWTAQGFLTVAGDGVRLTREGLCVADRVIAELMA